MSEPQRDVQQLIERIAEQQAREVAKQLNEIGVGSYGLTPSPESASIAEFMYVDTKAQLVKVLTEAFAAPDAQKAGE
jgi:hypothetical protein